MDDKQETIADIIAEMRDRKEMLGNAISSAPLCYPVDNMEAKVEILDEFIDRIEAAHKREVDALTKKLETANHCWKLWRDRADELLTKCNEQYAKLKIVGISAKVRNALEQIASIPMPPPIHLAQQCASEMREKAIAALAAPPRNCDVGTPEERAKRYHEFCRGRVCESCPAFTDEKDDLEDGSCIIQWEDMPYRSNEGGKE